MDIYNYSPVTGEFISRGVAQPSPLEKGKFLIPANATTKVPPTIRVDEAAVLVNGVWTVVPDHRGKMFYQIDGTEVELNLGDVPGPELSETLPADVQLARTKEIKRNEIREAFNIDSLLPVSVNGVEYHGGIDSATKLDGVYRLSIKLGLSDVTFTDINNISVVLNLNLADEVIIAVGTDYQTKFMNKQQKMLDIENADNLTSVNAITY